MLVLLGKVAPGRLIGLGLEVGLCKFGNIQIGEAGTESLRIKIERQ